MILSTGEGTHGCQGACVVARGACIVAGGHAWLLGGVRGCWEVCACWGACMVAGGVWIRRDTDNERAVRILLECILVYYQFPLKVH